MANTTFKDKLFGLSHHLEMIARRIVWNKYLNSIFMIKSINVNRKKALDVQKIDLSNIINHLKQCGVSRGDILIVHSSYSQFKRSGISPQEVIDALIQLISKDGTLVMPAIRNFANDSVGVNRLYDSIEGMISVYNPKTTPIWTGALPNVLKSMKGVVLSRVPLNSLVAFGRDAEEMFKNELKDSIPTPNGKNSGWAYCLKKNAWIISLATDLTHSLTSIHTTEDLDPENWPIEGWYRKRSFLIDDGSKRIKKEFLERRPRWGMLHFGERKLSRDLQKNNIIQSSVIDSVQIEIARSLDLHNYLNSKNMRGYPYFWVKKYLKE